MSLVAGVEGTIEAKDADSVIVRVGGGILLRVNPLVLLVLRRDPANRGQAQPAATASARQTSRILASLSVPMYCRSPRWSTV